MKGKYIEDHRFQTIHPAFEKTRIGDPEEKENPRMEGQKMEGRIESFIVKSFPENIRPI
jgi:hypothetical protein